MLRTLNIKNAVDYHRQSLTQGDYYTERGEMAGEWGGKASQLLGLQGEVNQKDFASVCENKHPLDQTQLTARNIINRRQAYDFTFSVPKSVSIHEAITSDTRISNLVIESMQETMSEIESCFQARVRTDGRWENRITNNLSYAYFLHKNSRPIDSYPDPHIHIHTIVMNLTFDEVENKWKAGEFADKKTNAPYYQAIFDSKLANKLIDLGFEIRKVPGSFEIAQYDRPTIDQFSRRTKEIEAKIEELELTNDKDKDKIGALIRNNKNDNYTQSDLKKKYIEILGTQKAQGLQSLIPTIEQISKTKLLSSRPIIVDADHFKTMHSDYKNDNHHIYGKMAKELFFEALQIPEIPSVTFTGGGSGSGKSEIILKQLILENYQGIIVDGTLANYAQAVDNINRSLQAGKTVELRGIVTDLERAYGFVLKREAETGRGVPLDTFLDKQFGFIESFPKLAKEFEDNPNVRFVLYDKRNSGSEEKLVQKNLILDFFDGLEYNKDITKAKLQAYEHRIQTNNPESLRLSKANSVTSSKQSKNNDRGIGEQYSAQNTQHRIRNQERESPSRQNLGSIDERSGIESRFGGRNIVSDIGAENQNLEITKKQNLEKAKFWVNYNLEKNFERNSTITDQTLIAQTLMEGIGQTDLDTVRQVVKDLTVNGVLIQDNLSQTELGKLNNLSKTITTQVVLSEEKQLVEFVNLQKDKYTPFNFNYSKELAKNKLLNENQKQVVLDVLNSSDGVILIQGRAGTGKTTVLKEIEKGIVAHDKRVLALAPTLKAVEILKQDFDNSATLQSFINFDKDKISKVEKKVGFFDKLLGKKNVEPIIDLNPPRGSILLVDESSLVSTREMTKLFSKSNSEGYRVILIGDSRQHKSVQRGNCLKLLEEHSKIESFSLSKILRQKTTDQIKAVEYLASGNVDKGLNQFQKLGSVVEIKDDLERANQLSKVYLTEYKLNKTPPLVITPTHHDGDLVSLAIRNQLKEAGLIGIENGKNSIQTLPDQNFTTLQNLNLTEVEKQLIDNYKIGQVIQFKQNSGMFKRNDKYVVAEENKNKTLKMQNLEITESGQYDIPLQSSKHFDLNTQKDIGLTSNDWITVNRKAEVLDVKGNSHNLNNGSSYQIKQITNDGQIQLTNDYLIPKSFQNFKSGYYSTSYAAQGQTVKTSLFYCTQNSKPAINQDLVYVSSSRFKNKHFIFVPDFEQFKKDASKGLLKSIGMDIAQTQDKPSFSQRQKPLLEVSKGLGIKKRR